LVFTLRRAIWTARGASPLPSGRRAGVGDCQRCDGAGDKDRAKALVELMPSAKDRAAMFQSILANGRNPPTTAAAVVEQINQLPSAYDRSLAYLARAQDTWFQSGSAR
jgi:hypothetical protein